jgi:molecular chaperone GrpE
VSFSARPDSSDAATAVDCQPQSAPGEPGVAECPPASVAPAAYMDRPRAPTATDVGAIESRLELLNSLVAETVRLGQDRERILDKLHRENQNLRAGELERAVAPVLRDLVRLRDDMAAAAVRLRKVPAALTESLIQELDAFCEGVVDILGRQGCELYAPTVGERFESREHCPSSIRHTALEAMDARIAEVLKPGFRHHGRIFRPAHVVVNRYQPSPRTNDDAIPSSPPPTEPQSVEAHQER